MVLVGDFFGGMMGFDGMDRSVKQAKEVEQKAEPRSNAGYATFRTGSTLINTLRTLFTETQYSTFQYFV